MQFTSLGGAYEIGGSCHLIQAAGRNILLDCGVRVADPKHALPDFDRLRQLSDGRVDVAFVTHAHLDHIGAVPRLHAEYPDTPIITTRATAALARAMLGTLTHPTAAAQAPDAPELGLWNSSEVDRASAALIVQATGEWFEPVEGVRAYLHPSGHVLGAAAVLIETLETDKCKLIYTGDMSATAQRMSSSMQPIDFFQPDLLILEGTHGDAAHPGHKAQEQALARTIADVVESGGTALVPSYAFGRAQEIILLLRASMMTGLIRRFPIFVDGAVAELCEKHKDLIDELPEPLRKYLFNSQQPLFWGATTGTAPEIHRVDAAKRSDLFSSGPKCLVTASGRLTGGLGAFYAEVFADDPRSAVFISDDGDEEHPGEHLATLRSGDTLRLDDGAEITVRCRVEHFRLAMHADQIQLCQHVSYMEPGSIVLVHGRSTSLQALRQKLMAKYSVFVPLNGDTFDPLSDPARRVEPRADASSPGTDALPDDSLVAVTIIEDEDGVSLRFDGELLAHPEWQRFFQGYERVEARFDGRRLRLKATVDKDGT